MYSRCIALLVKYFYSWRRYKDIVRVLPTWFGYWPTWFGYCRHGSGTGRHGSGTGYKVRVLADMHRVLADMHRVLTDMHRVLADMHWVSGVGRPLRVSPIGHHTRLLFVAASIVQNGCSFWQETMIDKAECSDIEGELMRRGGRLSEWLTAREWDWQSEWSWRSTFTETHHHSCMIMFCNCQISYMSKLPARHLCMRGQPRMH